MRHILKTDQEPFQQIWNGYKTAEFRREDTRVFTTFDGLDLLEQTEPGRYTGRSIVARVTHVQRGYGIPPGFAMVSFRVLSKNERAEKPEHTRESQMQDEEPKHPPDSKASHEAAEALKAKGIQPCYVCGRAKATCDKEAEEIGWDDCEEWASH